MANSTNAVIDVKVAGAQSASREMDRFGQSIKRASGAQAQLAGSANKANQSLRLIRGGAGQLGHQIQDIAVQLQGGTSAMIVFGQQGSQIASLFGPKGALIGAVLAVGAAIGTTLFNSMKSSKQMMEELSSSITDISSLMSTDAAGSVDVLSKKFLEFAKVNRNLAELQLRTSYASAVMNVKNANGLLGDSVDDLIYKNNNFKKTQINLEGAMKRSASSFGLTYDQYVALNAASLNLKKGAEGSAESFVSLSNQILEAGNGNEKLYEILTPVLEIASGMMNAEKQAQFLKKALQDLPAALQMSEITFDPTGAIKALNAVRDEATNTMSSEFFAGVTSFDKLEQSFQTELQIFQKQQEDKLALIDQHESEVNSVLVNYADLRKKIAQETAEYEQAAMLTATQSVMGAMQQQVGQLSGLFDQASGIGKAFYLMNQTMSAGMAIINGYAASMNIIKNATAMGIDPGTASTMGQFAVGMGYASAGAIMGQALASFEGGGFTGFGVRSGGMDGKGGRLAMVHPNEKITDLEKSRGYGGSPINVSLNISAVDTKGFDKLLAEKQGMIVSMVNRAVNNAGRRSLA